MPTLLLEFVPVEIRIKQKIDRTHLWFDFVANKLLSFQGGKLVFAWNQEEKRLLPKIEDAYETVKQMTNNRRLIEKWIDQVGNRIGIEVNAEESSNKGISIDINDSDRNLVEHALDRYGIRYSEI